MPSGTFLEHAIQFFRDTWTAMLDPYMLGGGIGIAILAAALYFFGFHNKEEDGFEKNQKAFNVLYGKKNVENKDSKPKVAKKDKKKQKTPDESESEQEKEVKKEVVPKEVKKDVVSKEAKKEVVPKVTAAPPQPKQKEQPLLQTTPPKQQEQPKKESPKEPKKKQVKPVNPKDLDLKKVLTRLSAYEDLDDGYIQYLTSTFRDNEVQRNSLGNEVKALHKKIGESQQKIDKLQKDKTTWDQKEKNEQSQRNQLGIKLQAAQVRETELSRQVATVNASLQNKENEHSKEVQENRKKIQQLETEVNTFKTNNSRSVGQLKTAQLQLREQQSRTITQKNEFDALMGMREAEYTRVNESLEHLNTVVTTAERELAETGEQLIKLSHEVAHLKAVNSELENTLAATRLALDNQSKHDTEKKNSEADSLKEEREKWLAEKQLMTEKYVRLEELIKELNHDISDFHAYKEQQEVIVGELNKRDESRVEELATEKEQSQAKEEQLLKQIADGKQMLADVKKALEEEKSRVVEIPKNAPEPVVEEVFELKKTQVDLAAAPSTSVSDDAEKQKLKAENEKLKAEHSSLEEKNAELRQRNMTILEKTEAVPNQLVNERKRVVTGLVKLSEKQFKSFADEDAYHEWFDESVSGIEKSLSAAQSPTSVSAPVSTPAPKAQKSAPVQQVAVGNEGVCREALLSLKKQLEVIQELADQKDRRHEEEIAQLRAQRA